MVYLLLTQLGGLLEEKLAGLRDALGNMKSAWGTMDDERSRSIQCTGPTQGYSRELEDVFYGGGEPLDDTRGRIMKGHERSWLVKTVTTAASVQPMGIGAEQPLSSLPLGVEEETRPEEAFEATILRLDATTLERILKLAGE